MGYTIPAAIGVCYAKNKQEVIGVTGEGSFQMNLQELQTIVHNQLPIKLFIWNNGGYLSIKATQKKFFKGDYIGIDDASGISFPELEKLSDAYGIHYIKISNTNELDEKLEETIKFEGALICEVMCDIDQEVIPTLSSFKDKDGKITSKPIEDMYPFLYREEF